MFFIIYPCLYDDVLAGNIKMYLFLVTVIRDLNVNISSLNNVTPRYSPKEQGYFVCRLENEDMCAMYFEYFFETRLQKCRVRFAVLCMDLFSRGTGSIPTNVTFLKHIYFLNYSMTP